MTVRSLSFYKGLVTLFIWLSINCILYSLRKQKKVLRKAGKKTDDRRIGKIPLLFSLPRLSLLPFLNSFLPSFPPSLPSFLPSFLISFLPFFLPSFLPSFLSSFLPSFLPYLFPSFLPSKQKLAKTLESNTSQHLSYSIFNLYLFLSSLSSVFNFFKSRYLLYKL